MSLYARYSALLDGVLDDLQSDGVLPADANRRAVAVARTAHTVEALALGLDGLKNAYAYLGEVGPLTEVIGELEPMLREIKPRQ